MVLEIVVQGGHLVLKGAETGPLQRMLQAVRVSRSRRDGPAPVVRSDQPTNAGGPAPVPIVRPHVRVFHPPTLLRGAPLWERDGLLYVEAGGRTFAALKCGYQKLRAVAVARRERACETSTLHSVNKMEESQVENVGLG